MTQPPRSPKSARPARTSDGLMRAVPSGGGSPRPLEEFSMAEEIAIGGITVPLSPAGKGLFPDDGITKEDLARYFADWIRRVAVDKEGGVVEHVVCDKPATLVYLANQACIEIHEFTSRADKLQMPDQMVFDFDPPGDKRFADVRRAALWARDLLNGELDLTSFVRTSGGRGLHVHVALNRRADFDSVRDFAHRTAELLARRHPDVITTEQRKDKRGDRIYADVMRNAYAQTVVASYSVRARAGAPVATPLSWPEVEDDGLEPGQFTMATVRARLDRTEDPWAGFTDARQGLSEAEKRLTKLDA